jgi:O-antigen/teichoic acid export membrane protein
MSEITAGLPFMAKLDQHMKELLRGASIAFVLKSVAAVASFGFSVLLARLLGAHGAGMYFQALTLATIADVVGKVGLPNTIVRFTAASATLGQWDRIGDLNRKVLKIGLCTSCCAGLLLAGSSRFLAERVFSEPELSGIIRGMSLSVVPIVLAFLYAHLLKGLKRIAEAVSIESAFLQLLLLIGTFLLVPRWGVWGAVWAYLAAASIDLLLGAYLWRRATPKARVNKGSFDTGELLRSSMPLFWASILQLATQWSSTLMLGFFKTSTEVGIFSAANRTATLTSFILIAVNSIAAPKFAAMFKQGDMKALGRTARHAAKLMIFMTGPPLVLFLFFPGWVMSIFGPQFASGKAVLSIVTLGQFINVATGSVGFLLMMCGQERLMKNISILSALVNVGCNAALVPSFGLIGAAVATAATVSLQNLLAAAAVWRRLGIWTIPFVPRPSGRREEPQN